ncbi:hypothetical protein EDB19DRAFT_1895674 [Suillus lakei]|nr:hypothetical protein EDB19DRAFT_1895674 [Suillus lakei]
MSRFVRASKYRHVFGQAAKKEHGYENVKVSGSAWDTNLVSASGRYISVNWNASGGGAFAILPLPSPFAAVPNFPYKLPDHPSSTPDWSPHNDSIVASAGEDGKVMIWKVESSAFEDWGQDHWVPEDFDPVARIDASPRKIGQVLFHPTAASGEHTVKLWDLADTDRPRSCLAFNPTWHTQWRRPVETKKLRLFDPRAGGEAGARVVWMGDLDKIVTTGFSKMSDRQVSIWETGGLGSVKTMTIDQSAGVIMPFWSDNGILFLAEHKSLDPQRGICFLPRRALNVSDCEIARAYKVSGSSVEPIAFIVPRKADSFQSDIYPAAASSEPSLSGKRLVSLENGAVFNGAQSTFTPPAPAPAPTHAPAPTAFSAPPPVTKAVSMPTPAPQTPLPRPASPISESPVILTPPTQVDDDGKPTVLETEVDRLNNELRAAREKIRNMELQVEGLKANARKAAQALMEG